MRKSPLDRIARTRSVSIEIKRKSRKTHRSNGFLHLSFGNHGIDESDPYWIIVHFGSHSTLAPTHAHIKCWSTTSCSETWLNNNNNKRWNVTTHKKRQTITNHICLFGKENSCSYVDLFRLPKKISIVTKGCIANFNPDNVKNNIHSKLTR